MCVCLIVCALAFLLNHASKFYQIYVHVRPACCRFKSYMDAIRQQSSTFVYIPYYVPQGSVLGPRLLAKSWGPRLRTWRQLSRVCWRHAVVLALSSWQQDVCCLATLKLHQGSQPLDVCQPTQAERGKDGSCCGPGHVVVQLCWRALVRRCGSELKPSQRVTKSVFLVWPCRQSWFSTNMSPTSVRRASADCASSDGSDVHLMPSQRPH